LIVLTLIVGSLFTLAASMSLIVHLIKSRSKNNDLCALLADIILSKIIALLHRQIQKRQSKAFKDKNHG